jgi:phage/plasmid-associated DNA primase
VFYYFVIIEYKNNKWGKIDKNNIVLLNKVLISTNNIYKTLIKFYKENDNDTKKIIKLEIIFKSLKNTVFQNNILTQLKRIFFTKNNPNRNFVKNLDINNNLISFTNGVYDLSTMEFREGHPSDNISMSNLKSEI